MIPKLFDQEEPDTGSLSSDFNIQTFSSAGGGGVDGAVRLGEVSEPGSRRSSCRGEGELQQGQNKEKIDPNSFGGNLTRRLIQFFFGVKI